MNKKEITIKIIAWFIMGIMVGLIMAVLLVRSAYASTGISVPDQSDYVTDTANVIDEATEEKLNQEIGDFEKRTTNQIGVLTIDSLNDQSIEEYSIAVVDKWKLGQKEKDNGVLILFSMNDHKMRIEVGRGLEGQLTDIQSQSILDDDVRPLMRSGDPSAGASAAVDDIIKTLDPNSPQASASATNNQNDDNVAAGIAVVIVIVIIAIVLLIFFMGMVHNDMDDPEPYDSSTGLGSLGSNLEGMASGAALGALVKGISSDSSDNSSDDSDSSSGSSSGGDDNGSDNGSGNGTGDDGFSGGGGGSFSGGGASSSW